MPRVAFLPSAVRCFGVTISPNFAPKCFSTPSIVECVPITFIITRKKGDLIHPASVMVTSVPAPVETRSYVQTPPHCDFSSVMTSVTRYDGGRTWRTSTLIVILPTSCTQTSWPLRGLPRTDDLKSECHLG